MVVTSAIVTGACCARAGAPVAPAAELGLRITGDPDCSGAAIAWTDASRADARRVIELSLASSDPMNDLAIAALAGVVPINVIVPDGVAMPDLHLVTRGSEVSRAGVGSTDVWYWKITIQDRFAQGALFAREQTVVGPEGQVAFALSVVCGGLRDSVPVVRWYGGHAD